MPQPLAERDARHAEALRSLRAAGAPLSSIDLADRLGLDGDRRLRATRAAKVYGPKAATHIRIYDASSPPTWPARWWW